MMLPKRSPAGRAVRVCTLVLRRSARRLRPRWRGPESPATAQSTRGGRGPAEGGAVRRPWLRLAPSAWYILTLGLILTLFSVVLYRTVASSLSRDLDRTLVLQADGVADSLFAFWRAERAATSSGAGPGNWVGSPPREFGDEVLQGRLPELLSRWAQKTGYLDVGRAVRLLDDDQQVLGASAAFTALELSDEALARAVPNPPRTGHAMLETPEGRRVRLVTRPIWQRGQVLYIVQQAASLQAMEASLRQLRAWLSILIPLTLLVVGAIGLLLDTAALRPVRRLIARTQRFSRQYLDEPLKLPKGAEVGELASAFDAMLGRVERAFHHLRRFSAAAAHELRTELTVLKGEISLALRRPRTAKEYETLLRNQLDAVNAMTETVEELLRLAHWKAAEMSVEREPVEVTELVRKTCDSFRAVAEARGVTVALETNGPLWVQGERHLLERVTANLLDNALKHTPAAGRVDVAIAAAGEEVHVTVRDTGPGIEPDELPHIFDRFFKPTVKGQLGPSGLGLGLCRWIVEAHHGRLDVASPPGAGAAFTFRLPLASPITNL